MAAGGDAPGVAAFFVGGGQQRGQARFGRRGVAVEKRGANVGLGGLCVAQEQMEPGALQQ